MIEEEVVTTIEVIEEDIVMIIEMIIEGEEVAVEVEALGGDTDENSKQINLGQNLLIRVSLC